ncbi:MAG: carboxypeptidase-like regulatory domain-containing protein [Thermoproteota archaeon]
MGAWSSRRITAVIALLFLLFTILFPQSSVVLNYASGSPANVWGSTVAYLDWNARLKVTVLTEDGRPLEGAWVYIVDAYSGGNVTAALTDENGNAGVLFTGQGDAPPPLDIEPGDRVDIGFNLLRGWFWLDENMRLTGEPVNPDWDPVSNNIPPQPLGDEYIQYVTFNGSSGWARFFGKYIVVVYYKYGGGDVLGPVEHQVVFDSYNDEPQHRYIYLGILPEGGGDYSASQSKIFRAHVGDIVLFFKDVKGRPLENVHVVFDKWDISGFTDGSGSLMIEKMPRTSYMITAEWVSRYRSKAVVRTAVEEDSVITMPVYDATLELLTPKGTPITVADVFLNDIHLGRTDTDGGIQATQVPVGSYKVSAEWLEVDLVLQNISVTTSSEITLTPSNVHSLTVMVRGAQGQALEGAGVTVLKNGVELVRMLTDKGGNVEVELPDGDYTIETSFDQFLEETQVTLTSDKLVRVELDVFVKIFGFSMTLSQTILLILAAIIIIIALAIVLHEYHIYRRKKLPQIFTTRTLKEK